MSDIAGSGFGFDHEWKYLDTPRSGITHYKCRACGALFTHFYDRTPSIARAMRDYGVPEHCAGVSEVVGSP